jgi:hypothetical protein
MGQGGEQVGEALVVGKLATLPLHQRTIATCICLR